MFWHGWPVSGSHPVCPMMLSVETQTLTRMASSKLPLPWRSHPALQVLPSPAFIDPSDNCERPQFNQYRLNSDFALTHSYICVFNASSWAQDYFTKKTKHRMWLKWIWRSWTANISLLFIIEVTTSLIHIVCVCGGGVCVLYGLSSYFRFLPE